MFRCLTRFEGSSKDDSGGILIEVEGSAYTWKKTEGVKPLRGVEGYDIPEGTTSFILGLK